MATEILTTSVATPLIKSFIDSVITPQIKKFAKKCGIAYKDLLIPRGEHFEEYLIRMYEKYSIINTLVFHNSQRKLKDIYVAQSLVKERYYAEKKKERIKVNKIPISLIKKYKRILITDTAGMGKSTIMKRMFIDLIDSGLNDVGIPIYIELNRLKTNWTILQEIQEEINSLSKNIDNELLLCFIQTGGFIFFLDGYDEITIADRNEVTKDIQSFISKAGTNNYYILTSRPEGGLASFGDFQSFNILPLTKKDAFVLLKKYDGSKNKEISNKLIKLLESGHYNTINEYLENPLLVSLLFAAFDHKQSIPLKKHLFYRQVYEAYFDSHDLSKGIEAHQKRSGLDIDDFNRVLRYVGFECLTSVGVKFDKDTILKVISKAKTYCGNLDFKESHFLSDLLSAVPLFCKDGAEYKWAHKSLLEYFAARFIYCDAKGNQDKILTTIYKSEHIDRYINMLDIYYDIDYKGFSKNITLPFCEEFIDFWNSTFTRDMTISPKLVDERRCLLFRRNYSLLVLEKKDTDSEVDNSTQIFIDQLGSENVGMCFGLSEKKGELWVNEFSDTFFFLAKLLQQKQISIFGEKLTDQCWRLNQELDIDFSEALTVEFGKVYMVNLQTGCKNEQIYGMMNEMLNNDMQQSLDYELCKREVKKIRDELFFDEDVSSLLSGI